MKLNPFEVLLTSIALTVLAIPMLAASKTSFSQRPNLISPACTVWPVAIDPHNPSQTVTTRTFKCQHPDRSDIEQ